MTPAELSAKFRELEERYEALIISGGGFMRDLYDFTVQLTAQTIQPTAPPTGTNAIFEVISTDKLLLRPNAPNRYLTTTALSIVEAAANVIGKRVYLSDASTLSGQPANHPPGYHIAGHDFDVEYPSNDGGIIGDVSQELNRLHVRDLYAMLMIVLKWTPSPKYIYIHESVMQCLIPICAADDYKFLLKLNLTADHTSHWHVSEGVS